MTVDVDKIHYASFLSGFKNHHHETGSATISAQSIPSGEVRSTTFAIGLDNVDSISSVKVRYQNEEAFWRQAQGIVFSTGHGGGNYSLQTTTYYENGQLIFLTYAINQTGGSINLPSVTILGSARLYRAPFGS